MNSMAIAPSWYSRDQLKEYESTKDDSFPAVQSDEHGSLQGPLVGC